MCNITYDCKNNDTLSENELD